MTPDDFENALGVALINSAARVKILHKALLEERTARGAAAAEIERLRARVEVLERVREAALTYLKAKTVEGARYAIDVLQEAKP
jgi:hypothetical protein